MGVGDGGAPPPDEQLRAELLAEMRRIHGLLVRRDGEALARLCALQARDYQRAYYLSSLDEAHRMLGLGQLLSDPSIEFEPFPDSILHVEILGGGRLVQLVDSEGKSPLLLRSSEAPEMVGHLGGALPDGPGLPDRPLILASPGLARRRSPPAARGGTLGDDQEAPHEPCRPHS